MQQAPAEVQTWVPGHAPQSRVPPQPSETFPHIPASQVFGVQQVPLRHV